MSVIYRSLQQLKREEAERNSRQAPQAVAPRMSKLFLRGLLFLLVFVVLAGSGLYFVQREVTQLALPEDPVQSAAGERQAVVEKTVEEAATPAEEKPTEVAQLAPAVTQAPIVQQRLYREPEPEKPKAIDLSKPSRALEQHFAQRAKQNESVLALERTLVQATRRGDGGQSREILDSMSREIGKQESATAYKWEGYLALREKRYAEAEGFFRRAVAIRASDYVSNINLVYALLGQGKRDEAVVIYRKLIDRYPTNDRVVKLGKALGQL
jgi:tetratricopeptide (TPR) repeat protein